MSELEVLLLFSFQWLNLCILYIFWSFRLLVIFVIRVRLIPNHSSLLAFPATLILILKEENGISLVLNWGKKIWHNLEMQYRHISKCCLLAISWSRLIHLRGVMFFHFMYIYYLNNPPMYEQRSHLLSFVLKMLLGLNTVLGTTTHAHKKVKSVLLLLLLSSTAFFLELKIYFI